VVLAQPRGAGHLAHGQGLPREQVAKIEANTDAHSRDLEQRSPCALHRDDGGRFARRQCTPARRDEAIDQPVAVGAAVTMMDVRNRDARIPGRSVADPRGDLARKLRRSERERPQLVPRGAVVGLGERNRPPGIADDRQSAEMDAVGRTIDLDEAVLAAAARADRTGERRTATLALAVTARQQMDTGCTYRLPDVKSILALTTTTFRHRSPFVDRGS